MKKVNVHTDTAIPQSKIKLKYFILPIIPLSCPIDCSAYIFFVFYPFFTLFAFLFTCPCRISPSCRESIRFFLPENLNQSSWCYSVSVRECIGCYWKILRLESLELLGDIEGVEKVLIYWHSRFRSKDKKYVTLGDVIFLCHMFDGRCEHLRTKGCKLFGRWLPYGTTVAVWGHAWGLSKVSCDFFGVQWRKFFHKCKK